MGKLVKYNLEIMSGVFLVFVLVSAINWRDLSLLRQMTVVFMILYTLHEWEESRFPGGFYKIFFSKCTISPTASEERMHFPVAVYLLIILPVSYFCEDVVVFAMVPLLLALFEGFIHTAGIVIHQLKKPYSPGMLTAWAMFAYAVVMIRTLNARMDLSGLTWVLGIVLTVVSFAIMETRFLKVAGITVREFQTSMRNHMLSRIRNRRKGENNK